MTTRAEAPWITNPFGLVSLKEILLMPNVDAEGYPTDEVLFGRFLNLNYLLGVLERPPLDQKNLIGLAVMAGLAADDLARWGFFVSAHATRQLVEMIEGKSVVTNLPTQIAMVRQALMTELATRVFVPVAAESARYYREPLHDWEEVTGRFPETISDIEEAGKCYALGRYAACVFHSMQVMEHGLLALGAFMKIVDPKSGFTAVANELQRIQNRKHPDLTEFEKTNLTFFQQINASVQAVKGAWRNKISHAQGAPQLMTADFSPAIAMEIYIATRGFMRRLATEMPQ